MRGRAVAAGSLALAAVVVAIACYRARRWANVQLRFGLLAGAAVLLALLVTGARSAPAYRWRGPEAVIPSRPVRRRPT